MLRATGVAGQPNEVHDKPHAEQEWADNRQTNPYGIKLNMPILKRLWHVADAEERRAAKFIRLTRHDTWRQAISQYRAKQSNVWHIWPDRESSDRHRQVAYDSEAIRAQYESLRGQNEKWTRWFADHDVQPLELSYETMCADPQRVVQQALEFLGLKYDGVVPTEQLKVTRDDLTEEWLRRLGVADDA